MYDSAVHNAVLKWRIQFRGRLIKGALHDYTQGSLAQPLVNCQGCMAVKAAL